MFNFEPDFWIAFGLTGAAALYAFFYGLFTRNYSTVDRIWSLMPGIYVLIWLPGALHSTRFLVAGFLVLAWCVRLTWNFAIKGGYARKDGRFVGEDYRWEVLRQRIPNRVAFEFFNFFFVSYYQLAQVFAFSVPLYILGKISAPLGPWDFVLFFSQALLLTLEATADVQQFRYYRKRGTADDARMNLGFNTYGLWRFSRHPNYVCEMGQWVVVSLYPLAAGAGWWPAGLGAAALVILFAGSTSMAEGITGGKYAAYADWKKATPAWLPFTLPFRIGARRRFWASLGAEAAEEKARA